MPQKEAGSSHFSQEVPDPDQDEKLRDIENHIRFLKLRTKYNPVADPMETQEQIIDLNRQRLELIRSQVIGEDEDRE